MKKNSTVLAIAYFAQWQVGANMLKVLLSSTLLLLTTNFVTTAIIAQIGPDPDYMVDDLELDDDLESYTPDIGELDSEDEALDDGGLFPRERTIRSTVKTGFDLSFGTTLPWQLYGGRFQYFFDSDHALTASIGGGDWRFKGEMSRQTYIIKGLAKNIHVGWRYFLVDIAPVYVEPTFSYVLWHGNVNPQGHDENTDDDVDEEKVRSGFSAHGVELGVRVGWQTIWQSGVYIDYCLFGFGRGILVDKSLTNGTSEAKKAVKQELEAPVIWGLVNIAVGYIF